MTHPNSRESLKRVDKDKRKAEIMDAFEREGKPMTDRQLARYLGYQDLNAIRPRVTELIAEKKLREYSTVICETTKRPVRKTMPVDGRLF
jgi:hypothetical protein